MSALAKRVSAEVLAKAAGGTVGPAVTALLASAAIVTGNPGLAVLSVPSGALLGAMTEQGVQLVGRTLLNRAERVSRFADAVEEETGQPIENFISDHVTDATGREFLGWVVDAVTAARSDWKIRVLAHAFVRGAKDGDLIDETEMFVNVTRDVEPTHARFLAALASTGSAWVRVDTLAERDPGIGPAGTILWRHLRDRGLVEATNPEATSGHNRFRITDLGHAVADWLQRLAPDLDRDVRDVPSSDEQKVPASGPTTRARPPAARATRPGPGRSESRATS